MILVAPSCSRMRQATGFVFLLLMAMILSGVALGQTPPRDLKSDTWVATDALGSQLPGHDECGPPRPNRTVGIFYLLWHGYHTPSGPAGGPWNISQIMAANPNALADSRDQSQGGPWGTRWYFHHWGEPELGYYKSADPYVIRKHCNMLVEAGIDVLVLDATNNPCTYPDDYTQLGDIYTQIRAAGGHTPQICWFARVQNMQTLYNDVYAQNRYRDLWFYWQGKPLFLLSQAYYTTDPEPSAALQEFFTIRKTWAWSWSAWFGNGQDRWLWTDTFPQAYGWHTPGVAEESAAAVAMQETYMSLPTAHGRHYHNGSQPPAEQWTGQGDHFQEQWQRVRNINPQFVLINEWNEWSAQRFVSGLDDDGTLAPPGYTFFVDQFTQEYSRDIEPMKEGHGDNYYYQMVASIRRHKGVRQPEYASPAKTIDIDGSFADWDSVSPEFRDPIGDTVHRNYSGLGAAGPYVDTTGRNDLVTLKVAHNADYVCFYAQTNATLTTYTDPKWMLLFIDADADDSTGWQGYDYLVNDQIVNTQLTTLKAWTGGSWSEVGQLPYRASGNELELRIPRTSIGQGGHLDVALDFHWADNIQTLGDVTEFALHGDSAPDRRFEYRYVADYTAPGQVANLSASRDWSNITLRWTNPSDQDFRGTMIRYRTDTFPASATDGTLLCDKANSPGSMDSQVHANAPAGTRHYYAVFTYDKVPNYCPPAHAEAMVPKPGDLDEDDDVDQDDFGRFQLCLTGEGVAQPESSCFFANFDGDSDVDQYDWGAFSRCMSGADVPSDPHCRQ